MELWYINGTAPYEYSEIIASFSFSKDKKVLALPEKTIDIPKFSRVLKNKNIGLYGDDVFYLQFLINYIYSYSSLIISGYYDEATEEAVRNVQKFEKMESTGIVDLNFWNSLTDTMNRFTTTYIYDFLNNLNNCTVENGETVYYQWQLRQTQINNPDKEKFFYELYLFESYTNERHLIVAFRNDFDFSYGNDINTRIPFVIFHKPVSTTIDYSIKIKGNYLLKVVYQSRYPKMQLQNETDTLTCLYELKTDKDVNFIEKELKQLEVPVFTRILEKNQGRKNLFGEDIYYLQVILNYYYNHKIDVDGYFGSETENAVKEFQRKANVKVTGIVDEKLWNMITKFEM